MFRLRHFFHIQLLFLAVSMCVTTGMVSAAEKTSGIPLKVGFVYTGSATDYGWNNEHDLGRRYLESTMKGTVLTTCAEKIPENSDCERVMEKMIAQGNKVIFATAYGFLEPLLRVASRHPDIRFMQCGRPVPPGQKNVGSYFCSEYYKILYTAGIIAGRMTKTNNIGYIGGHPIPSILWCINAFTLGARSVNPKVTVHVLWINSWEDPALESEATRGLIEGGCDVVSSNLNTSVTVARTAEKAKAYSIGNNFDLHSLVPNGWLTGQTWNWGPLYARTIKSIQNGTWKSDNLRYSLKDGYACLAPFGKSVPKPVQIQALRALQQLQQHKLEVFVPPLRDRDGKVRLAIGQTVDQSWLEGMNWFVSGIQGTLPKK